MVVVKLMGGLGNQMFQYACGRRIALANSVQLKLDTSDVKGKAGRVYGLGHLNISAEIALDTDIKHFKKSGLIRKLLYRAHLISKPFCEYNVVRERFFHFDARIPSLSDDTYLDGYWQSERYFSDIKDVIRREFTFKSEPDPENQRMAKMILPTNAVSLHIRRGDYVSDPTTNKVHGVCSAEYYNRAVKLIVSKVSRPHFFIFSDDQEWVRKNLRLDYQVTYVTHNLGDRSLEDLRLMSLCRYHIIANSSFSWWGAWLNQNSEKVVIAPAQWFNQFKADTRDLLPDSWIKL
jgi:hypothetical protein